MDQIFSAVCAIKVAILLPAQISAIDVGVDKLKNDLFFDKRVVFSKIIHQTVAMAIILINPQLLACNQNATLTFSVFLLSKVIFIITELYGLFQINSLSFSPSLWLINMEGILTLQPELSIIYRSHCLPLQLASSGLYHPLLWPFEPQVFEHSMLLSQNGTLLEELRQNCFLFHVILTIACLIIRFNIALWGKIRRGHQSSNDSLAKSVQKSEYGTNPKLAIEYDMFSKSGSFYPNA